MNNINQQTSRVVTLSPMQRAAPQLDYDINKLRTLIAEYVGIEVKRVTDEAHLNDDLGLDCLKRYGEVSHAVPPDQYAQAAQEALSKLSPEERAAFVKMLQDRAASRGVTLPRQVAPEPKELGQVLTDLHEKPGQLRDVLGGGAAQAQEQASGSSPITDILTSPMAKAVLAGIAAMVVKRVMARPS
jgi:hypothetical protein